MQKIYPGLYTKKLEPIGFLNPSPSMPKISQILDHKIPKSMRKPNKLIKSQTISLAKRFKTGQKLFQL